MRLAFRPNTCWVTLIWIERPYGRWVTPPSRYRYLKVTINPIKNKLNNIGNFSIRLNRKPKTLQLQQPTGICFCLIEAARCRCIIGIGQMCHASVYVTCTHEVPMQQSSPPNSTLNFFTCKTTLPTFLQDRLLSLLGNEGG